MGSHEEHTQYLIELKQRLDSYNEELDCLRRSDRPLSLIFNEGGSLLTLEEVNNPSIPTTQCVVFKLNFKHYRLTF